eukprot:2963619-Lingulodinium_polyedra.AAC.1
MWPMTGTDHEFMDTNHAIERSIKWQLQKEDEKLRNPWRVKVPTMIAKSSVAMRFVDKDLGLQIRRLHELEMMNLIGWD